MRKQEFEGIVGDLGASLIHISFRDSDANEVCMFSCGTRLTGFGATAYIIHVIGGTVVEVAQHYQIPIQLPLTSINDVNVAINTVVAAISSLDASMARTLMFALINAFASPGSQGLFYNLNLHEDNIGLVRTLIFKNDLVTSPTTYDNNGNLASLGIDIYTDVTQANISYSEFSLSDLI